MQAKVSHNTREIRSRMLSRAAAVASELRRENVRIAEMLTDASRSIMTTEVYSPPVDFNKDGTPKWIRSGDLRKADKWVAVGMSVVHRNTMPYFKRRYRYGKAGGTPAVSPRRASYWVRDAYRYRAGRIRAKRQAAIKRGWLRAGGGA